MTALAILAGIVLGAAGLGALIYHFAHKTAVGAAAQAAVASAAVAKISEIVGAPPKQ